MQATIPDRMMVAPARSDRVEALLPGQSNVLLAFQTFE
jgi:hypothetical protein